MDREGIFHGKRNMEVPVIEDPVDLSRGRKIIEKSKRVVVFSGAGISVESGIPDFRSPGGLWERFDPDTYAHFENFILEPKLFWEMCREMNKLLLAAAPNPAHMAIATLEKEGKLLSVITQNIDGLHQDAGISSNLVIELHGNAKSGKCIVCKESYSFTDMQNEELMGKIPKCLKCNGLVKPNVVLFGETLDHSVITSALGVCSSSSGGCDCMIIVGSSLQVSPANQLPLIAKSNGAAVIFVNLQPTPLDPIADVILRGKAAHLLPLLLTPSHL